MRNCTQCQMAFRTNSARWPESQTFGWLAASGSRKSFHPHPYITRVCPAISHICLSSPNLATALLANLWSGRCCQTAPNGKLRSGQIKWEMYYKEASVPDDKPVQINPQAEFNCRPSWWVVRLVEKGVHPCKWRTTNAFGAWRDGDWVQLQVTPHTNAANAAQRLIA